eukprot:jgi/Hompol1/7037/HPOL_003901-RA
MQPADTADTGDDTTQQIVDGMLEHLKLPSVNNSQALSTAISLACNVFSRHSGNTVHEATLKGLLSTISALTLAFVDVAQHRSGTTGDDESDAPDPPQFVESLALIEELAEL